jgi:hypothetical protein
VIGKRDQPLFDLNQTLIWLRVLKQHHRSSRENQLCANQFDRSNGRGRSGSVGVSISVTWSATQIKSHPISG